MLKIAVIGLGDISKIHIPVIQANPNVELVAVCDIDETLKDTVPGVKFYTDYHVMLEKEELGLCSYLFTTLSSLLLRQKHVWKKEFMYFRKNH